MVIPYGRVLINRVSLPILLVVSSTWKIIFTLFPFAPDNLISRDWFGRPVLRQPGSLFILRLTLVLTHGIPPNFRSGVHLFII